MTAGRVVVAGGTGLVGGALASELAAAGHEVVVLTRSGPGTRAGGVRLAQWDGRTAGDWERELDGARAVVNLVGENVGEGRWTAARKRALVASRLEPTRALVAAIARAGRKPEAFLQGSAVGFYGDRGAEPLDERSPPGHGFLPELCVEWEDAARPVEAEGVRRALLRTAIVLAREGGALPKVSRPFRLGLGAVLGDGRQYFPWIHLADEVAAIRFLLDRSDLAGPFLLAAPESVTNRDFSRALARTLRRPLFLRAPARALRLALGEMGDVLLAGQRVTSVRLPAAGFTFRFPRLDAALADLLTSRRVNQ